MSVTSSSDQSWFGRIGSSIKGILFGALLFFIAFPVLFMNEGRAVRTAKGLAEGAGAVVNIEAGQVDSQNEGKFVHLTGQATTDEILRDDDFGIELNGIRLTRHVEMYQWVETTSTKKKKKLGGGTRTVTTYDYDKEWSNDLNSTTNFEQPEGHQNPTSLPFSRHIVEAKKVNLGAFNLSDSLVGKITSSDPVDVNKDKLPEAIAERAKIVGDGDNGSKRLYLKAENSAAVSVDASTVDASTDAPEIGDVRIWFTSTPISDVSVMSKQVGSGFEPFKTHAGTNLSMLSEGTVSAEKMIEAAEAANAMLTWALRGLGTGMMCMGLALMLSPLAVIGDVVPFLGNIIGAGTTLVAGIVGTGIAFCTISVAWVVYRPLIGIPLLLIGLGLIFVIARKGFKKPNTEPRDAPLQVELVD